MNKQKFILEASVMIQNMGLKTNKKKFVYFNEFIQKAFDRYYLPILNFNINYSQLEVLDKAQRLTAIKLEKIKKKVVSKWVRKEFR